MSRLIAILLLLIIGCNTPAPVQRHPMVVTCFIGQLDSDIWCSSQGTSNASATQSLRCGMSGGKISKLEWNLVAHRGESDVYRLIRRFPADDAAPQVTTKEVAFSGERVVVFQDETHCIVVESPKK